MFGNILKNLKRKKALDGVREERILQIINKSGVPYGSRVWGGAQKASDYDYILQEDYYFLVKNYCDDQNIPYSAKVKDAYTHLSLGISRMLTFTINNKKYQLMVPSNFKKFSQAINLMTKFVDETKPNLSLRLSRVNTFEGFIRLTAYNDRNALRIDTYEFLENNYPEHLI